MSETMLPGTDVRERVAAIIDGGATPLERLLRAERVAIHAAARLYPGDREQFVDGALNAVTGIKLDAGSPAAYADGHALGRQLREWSERTAQQQGGTDE